MRREINEQEYLPIHIDYMPKRFYQKALEELNETPKSIEVGLQKLKDLLSTDRFTTDIEFEIDFLQLFLRHSKYNSTKAFQHLQKYIKFHRNNNSLFQSVPDECFQVQSTADYISVLPYRSPDGCVIVLQEFGKWNPSELSFEDFKRLNFLSFLQPLRCPMTQISGFKVIYDFKDTIKHFRYCTPQNLSLAYSAAFNCLPARYKEVHFINKTVVLSVIWSVLKLVLSGKMRQRIFFHSKPEDLLNHFPKPIIPTQYGGNLDVYYDAELMRKMNNDHANFPLGGMPNYF